MTDYLTDAWVLAKENLGEIDSIIHLYTRDLGKVIAKAKSGRKIVSKLGGHLEPLNIVKVRLVEKNGFQIADALALRRPAFNKPLIVAKLLSLANFIKDMTFEYQRDLKLWTVIKKILANPDDIDERAAYRSLLKILGFDPEFAACAKCKTKNVELFLKEEQIFLCRKCALKIPKNKVVSI